ncbi:MAG: helix-turn-helix transcriptional regulator [Candidatus Kuenenia sp.]|nr:helix-turn-helix transcriptional regulator [Candidatus Kuenenia hertensis]
MYLKKNTLGMKIRQLRKELGLNQDEFARKLSDYGIEITHSGISRIESGDHFPHIETLLAICMLCGLTPNEMLDYDCEKIQHKQALYNLGDHGAISSIG